MQRSTEYESPLKIAVLTGGKDPHYARGLVRELAAAGVDVALVGSADEMIGGVAVGPGQVRLYDFVGRQDPDGPFLMKVGRIAKYFGRLLAFATQTDRTVFHILWFRRFPRVERLFFMAYLKVLRKKVVFTAHNVDEGARDGRRRGVLEGFSLRVLYRLSDHIFVHTATMKRELTTTFAIPDSRVSVVPLGINDVLPVCDATRAEARQHLGVDANGRVLLFFGNIAPYKGLEDLIRALAELLRDGHQFMLIIAGRVKDRGAETYWRALEQLMAALRVRHHVRAELRYIPDAEVGIFFKAADVSVLPYRRVYQSGVLGLSYAQGLPVIAADVGAMREDIVEGETGFVCKPGNASDLAAKIRAYFASDLFADLAARAPRIRDHGEQRFSWQRNAASARTVYAALCR